MVDRSIDETLAAVTAADVGVDSVIALVAGLKQQLADALAGVTLPPGVQAKINSIFDLSTGDATKINTALSA
jgi:hypothetical protein